MYSEGEYRYLKDLDCVNIVKSIRELKALTRVILSQQQRQLLAFEQESVLPSNKALEKQEAEFIFIKVPLQYESSQNVTQYFEKVENFISEFSSNHLSNVDFNIIKEVSAGSDSEIQNSAQLFTSSKQPQTEHKIRPKPMRRDSEEWG